MSFFRRLSFLPDLEGLFIREVARLTSFVPTRYRWFDIAQLLPSGEPGATLWAFARIFSRISQQIEYQRTNILFSRLTDEQLDAVGAPLRMPRGPVELNDAYATRLAEFVAADKVTDEAMVALVRSLDATVGVFPYDRGRDLWILGDAEGCGAKRLADQKKYHGAVLDLILNKDLPRLMDLVPHFKAQGIYPTFTVLIETRHDYHGGTDAPLVNGLSELFVTGMRVERHESIVDTEDGLTGVGGHQIIEMFSSQANTVGALVAGVPIRPVQLAYNQYAEPDLDAWAIAGAPRYNLVFTPSAGYNTEAPTDWQPAFDITFSDATLGDGSLLGDPGLILG